MRPPAIRPEPDWEEFHLPFDIGSGRSMFVETERGPTIRMGFFRRKTDGALVGRVWFGEATFGPPGFVHGGVVSYVLDEAMGSCAWLAGYPTIMANLDVHFVEMTPLDEDCFIEARIVDLQPKTITVESVLTLGDQTLVRGNGLFVRLSRERFTKAFKGTRLPDLSGFEFV